GRSRFGTPQTVSSLTLDALEAWRKARYRPDNALVVVVGARDAKAALETVAAKLAKIPAAGGAPPGAPPVPAPRKGPQRASVESTAAARELLVAFRGPEPGSDDEAAFLALALRVKDLAGPALRPLAKEHGIQADARSSAPALL